MNNKKFKVKMKFVFTGEVEIWAPDKKQATEHAEKHFGLVIGGDLHSSSETIEDWEFAVHPEKKIIRVISKKD